MQTMTRIGTDVSLYLWPDDVVVVIDESSTRIGNPVNSIIADCSIGNAVIHTGVIAPDDWAPWKYTFNGANWAHNPNYIEVL